MADPLPSSETIAVLTRQIRRLRRLTLISLSFSGLILFLFVVGGIMHHHRDREEGRGFGERDGGFRDGQCHWGGGHRFHHFGGMNRGWGRPDDRDDRDGGPGGPRGWGGPGGDRGPGPGGPGGPGGGFGMRGMGGPMGAPPDPAKMTDNVLNMLSTKLTLTDDQKAKLKPIIADQVTQIQKDMEAQRAAMQKDIEDAKAKIKPLLTPDQQKQLDALPIPGQKGPPPPPPPPGQ